MAQYKTNAEAAQALAKDLQTKARELKGIYDSTNPKEQARAEQLKTEIGAIQNQLMIGSGMMGAIGGGAAKGIVQAATAIPDLARMAGNYFTGQNLPMLGEQLTPGLKVSSEDKRHPGHRPQLDQDALGHDKAQLLGSQAFQGLPGGL